MGGKGSGNRMVAKNQAWKKSPVIGDNGITATKEEISKITAHALEIALWDEIDTKDPEQLRDRTLKYLQYCIDNNIKPGNLGLYREQLRSDGKINPVTGIFWQKNWDGLKDQQEVVLEPRRQIEADQTPEQVQQMLEADIPLDEDPS